MTTPYPTLRLHIAGQWLSHCSGGSQEVRNPADNSLLGELPLAGAAELNAAAASAEAGFKAWNKTFANERYKILRKAAELMRQRSEEAAIVLTLEQGKPRAEALREILLSCDIIDFQAEEAKRLYGRTVPPRVAGVLSQTVTRQPVGPVAAFTAWNFPSNLPARKIASALAAGCSVVIKPAEETPATCMLMVQAFLDAGVPPEALSMVCGDPAQVSQLLIAHDAIRKASLTGSVAVGKLLGELCARGMKRFTAELGGHAPVLVCSDADVAFSVKQSLAAKFRNAGQVCTSPIRFFIHRSIAAQWIDSFVAGAAALKLGSGMDPATQMGPLTHGRRIEDMERFLADARQSGAEILTGGQRRAGPGFFYQPTVIANAPKSSLVQRMEPFGPIAVVEAFDDLDQAMADANALPYGLSAYAFTRDLRTAHQLAEGLEAGMVGINHFGVSQPEMPFGGWKESGLGQEMGLEGLLHYTDIKTVSMGVPS